jgi:hypothetical protein
MRSRSGERHYRDKSASIERMRLELSEMMGTHTIEKDRIALERSEDRMKLLFPSVSFIPP